MFFTRFFLCLYTLCSCLFAAGSAKDCQVLGIGAPCMDILMHVDDDFLHSWGGKGGSMPMDRAYIQNLLHNAHHKNSVFAAGGSCANTIKGLAHMGHSCGLFGKMGNDRMGELFNENIKRKGIHSFCLYSDSPTLVVVSMISPDGERTMRSCQGADIEMNVQDLTPDLFCGVQHVHIEGYVLYSHDRKYASTVMKLAKDAGATISLDVSSFQLVHQFRDTLLELIAGYVDVLFSNSDEVFVLLGKGPEEGCKELSKICSIAVVTTGKEGCFVGANGMAMHSPSFSASVVDTTGAGDLFPNRAHSTKGHPAK